MAATADVELWKGGSDGSPGTETTVTQVRLRTDDNADTIDNTNPIPIPAAGFNYSYYIHLCLTLSGTFTQVDNIRHYTDGSEFTGLGTSGEIRRGNRDAGDHGVLKTNYDLATGTPGTTGDDLTTAHAWYSGQTVKSTDVFSDTDPGVVIDSTAIVAPGDSKAVVLQAKIDTDATSGAKTQETFTFKYDEI